MVKTFLFIVYVLTILYIWIKAYFENNYVGDKRKYSFSMKYIIIHCVKFWTYVPFINTLLLIILEIDDYINRQIDDIKIFE